MSARSLRLGRVGYWTDRHVGEGAAGGIFRRLLGEVLRAQRMRQGRTLRQVSAELG